MEMKPEKVYEMPFSKLYPLWVAKAGRKGRTQAETDAVICWLTGYREEELAALADSAVTCGAFFRNAPRPNPNRSRITGMVCGVRVEEIQDPLMREIRYLDKLIDELAKGWPLEKIFRS